MFSTFFQFKSASINSGFFWRRNAKNDVQLWSHLSKDEIWAWPHWIWSPPTDLWAYLPADRSVCLSNSLQQRSAKLKIESFEREVESGHSCGRSEAGWNAGFDTLGNFLSLFAEIEKLMRCICGTRTSVSFYWYFGVLWSTLVSLMCTELHIMYCVTWFESCTNFKYNYKLISSKISFNIRFLRWGNFLTHILAFIEFFIKLWFS